MENKLNEEQKKKIKLVTDSKDLENVIIKTKRIMLNKNKIASKLELKKLIEDTDRIMEEGIDLENTLYDETDIDYSQLSEEFIEDYDE